MKIKGIISILVLILSISCINPIDTSNRLVFSVEEMCIDCIDYSSWACSMVVMNVIDHLKVIKKNIDNIERNEKEEIITNVLKAKSIIDNKFPEIYTEEIQITGMIINIDLFNKLLRRKENAIELKLEIEYIQKTIEEILEGNK